MQIAATLVKGKARILFGSQTKVLTPYKKLLNLVPMEIALKIYHYSNVSSVDLRFFRKVNTVWLGHNKVSKV